ncbi:MAG: cation:proton antiporter [Planctomycetes bacterium]|nr:cation:proton antiporter [Planctomycetota bacterium]
MSTLLPILSTAGPHSSLILTVTMGLGFALVLGLAAKRIGLSPIIGYLVAGIVVGPYTPGFQADPDLAAQLAEIGVILLMFGVGLHFQLKDLWKVKGIAITGALVQSSVATLLCTLLALMWGWKLEAGLVLGLAVSVASTVVLLRVLQDANLVETPAGRAAVGWLIVEDILTVLVLVMLPLVADAMHSQGDTMKIVEGFGLATLKLIALGVVVFLVGGKVVSWLLSGVARMRSRELFTLTVLALALGLAWLSATVFGASMALGAFLAGMIVGQSDVHHQAAADAHPMRDAFAVLFFVSVGMLFDPYFVLGRPELVAAVLGVILLGKPLAALSIVLVLRKPLRTALVAGLGLAQIGEFSFILGELGFSLGMVPQEARSVLVAAALISIAINPILFRNLPRIENWIRRNPKLWAMLNPGKIEDDPPPIGGTGKPGAIVCGYGPVGKTVTRILRDCGLSPTVIDLNVDTVKKLKAEDGVHAVYGDAANREVIEAAGGKDAQFLLLCLPDAKGHTEIIKAVRALNPAIKVLVRAHYIADYAMLAKAKPDAIAFEEAEVAVTLAEQLLEAIGVPEEEIERQVDRARAELNTASGGNGISGRSSMSGRRNAVPPA